MAETWAERIESLVKQSPGLTDREITDRLANRDAPQQTVNQTARVLEGRGRISRRRRPDGLIGSFPSDNANVTLTRSAPILARPSTADGLSEDEVKQFLERYLAAAGWCSQIAWGYQRGVDIDARRENERWLIEVKGSGSRSEMRVSYFIGMLGELLQRMDDPAARYSIALPDMQQFRRLWERLPSLAKQRVQVSALFVAEDGSVTELG